MSEALKELGVNMSPQEIMGMTAQPGRMQPLAGTEMRQPGSVQSPQEAQMSEFGLEPQGATMLPTGL